MALSYKLVMFGFPALCEDIDEGASKDAPDPPERAKVETLEQCYVIDLHTGVRYEIACDEKGFYICDFSADTSE